MDEIISYKMCAVKVRNAKLRNYLKGVSLKACGTVCGTAQPRSQGFRMRTRGETRKPWSGPVT